MNVYKYPLVLFLLWSILSFQESIAIGENSNEPYEVDGVENINSIAEKFFILSQAI